ncbi:hypothetical protein MPSEU_000521500 [Mayamaea pseudoterrestris]|nr:hypothetical protein MPSEU_000521500 [Mayamaea pseudoterrestris]
MRIQITPWEIIQTSLNIDYLKRPRKEGCNSDSNGSLNPSASFPVAACFVHRQHAPYSLQKKARKLKVHSNLSLGRLDDVPPVLAVTLSHNIAIFGSSRNRPDDENLKEIAHLQYSSQHNQPKSFLSEASSKSMRMIPAMFDDRHDRVYALQADQCRLVSWKASTGGPDLDAVSVKLRSAAASLSFINMPVGPSLVYGSCADGSLFLARIKREATGADTWLVEYLPTAPIITNGTANSRIHVHTCMHLECLTFDHQNTTGDKRKPRAITTYGNDASTTIHSPTILIYQAFLESNKIDLCLQKRILTTSIVRCSRVEPFVSGEADCRIKTALVPLVVGSVRASATVTGIQSLSGTQTNGASHLDLALLVKAKADLVESDCCFVCVTLEDATRGPSYILPSDVTHVGAVGTDYLVAATAKDLFLYDRNRGARLYTCTLDFIKTGHIFTLVSDEASDRFAVVFSEGETLCVATSSIRHGFRFPQPVGMTLAETLAATVNTPLQHLPSFPAKSYELANGFCEQHQCCEALEKAIGVLQTALDDVRYETRELMDESHLLHAFHPKLLAYPAHDTDVKEANDEKIPKTTATLGETNRIFGNGHGCFHSGEKIQKLSSLSKSILKALKTPLPSNFVEVAAKKCVELLLLEGRKRNTISSDALQLLCGLIATHHTSARRCLEGDAFLHLLNVLRVSSFEVSLRGLILQVLKQPDVSELHMVGMIQFCIQNVPGFSSHKTPSKAKAMASAALSSLFKFFDSLLSYSAVNDALLRAAAKTVLNQDECYTAIRLLIAFMSGRFRNKILRQDRRSRAMQWIGILIEVMGETMPGKSRLGPVQRLIIAEIKGIESMLSMKMLVDERVIALATSDLQVGGALAKPAILQQQPPYLIERVVF